MLPAIPPGACLSIEPGQFKDHNPQPGEIIAFRRGDGLVCHRYYGVLRIGRRRYGIEKGDRNRIAGLFRPEAYAGRLIAVDTRAATDLFCSVKKPSAWVLFGGLIRERLDWICRKTPAK